MAGKSGVAEGPRIEVSDVPEVAEGAARCNPWDLDNGAPDVFNQLCKIAARGLREPTRPEFEAVGQIRILFCSIMRLCITPAICLASSACLMQMQLIAPLFIKEECRPSMVEDYHQF